MSKKQKTSTPAETTQAPELSTEAPKAPKAPKPIERSLHFRFPADFYQTSAEMTMFSRNGDTFLRWPNGNLSPLIPIGADEWVDRSYWEPVRLDRDPSGVPAALYYDRFRGDLVP